ncbi:MAG: AI-2E family transporter [Chloroflexota bacterium]|nr:AI-2E family transporter [Chloroflexota bacterium]
MNKEYQTKNPEEARPSSPRWNWPTKLVFGIALVAILIWVLIQFQSFLGPIIMAFMLTYLFFPLARFVQNKIKLSWRASVTIIYLLTILILVGLLTWGGLALGDQIQNLVNFVQNNIDELPQLVEEFTQQTYAIGPFELGFSVIDWNSIANQIVNAIQPIVGQVGSVVGTVVGGAANVIFWVGLILIVSYFLLAESEGAESRFIKIRIPGYTEDIRRIGLELDKIWNAYIRGQIIVVLVTILFYTGFLGTMGIQFFFGLAVLAAVGHFVPYLGAWISWITFFLVALLQGSTIFNLPAGIYALIIVGVSIVIDSLIDNLITPKIMSENLKVHPALVLVGAMIGLDFLGVIGIILASPVMATVKLFFTYIVKKLTDQNPWENLENMKQEDKAKWVTTLENLWAKVGPGLTKALRSIGAWFARLWQSIKSWWRRLWARRKDHD